MMTLSILLFPEDAFSQNSFVRSPLSVSVCECVCVCVCVCIKPQAPVGIYVLILQDGATSASMPQEPRRLSPCCRPEHVFSHL